MHDTHPAERFFSSAHPLSTYLSVTFEGVENGVLTVSFTAPPQFVVDGETIHSGLATLILDTAMGGAVMGSLDKIQPIATTGLTVQHMRRPRSGERLRCKARVEGIHSEMAHVSGSLLAGDSGEILSTATGTFMIGTRAKPLGVRV
jgi:acyl-coenzyme A thioesterase PaaI-like protein